MSLTKQFNYIPAGDGKTAILFFTVHKYFPLPGSFLFYLPLPNTLEGNAE